MNRRTFLGLGIGTACGLSFGRFPSAGAAGASEEPFTISLADVVIEQDHSRGERWTISISPALPSRISASIASEFVDQYFKDKANDKAYLKELQKRADSEGVRMGLIMIDTNGPLGAARDSQRKRANRPNEGLDRRRGVSWMSHRPRERAGFGGSG